VPHNPHADIAVSFTTILVVRSLLRPLLLGLSLLSSMYLAGIFISEEVPLSRSCARTSSSPGGYRTVILSRGWLSLAPILRYTSGHLISDSRCFAHRLRRYHLPQAGAGRGSASFLADIRTKQWVLRTLRGVNASIVLLASGSLLYTDCGRLAI